MRIVSTLATIALAQFLLFSTSQPATAGAATQNADEQAVSTVLLTYQTALNASNADAALRLYATDAVTMAQNTPSSVGIAAVRKAYIATFEAITLHVRFHIAEVRQVAPTWAFARTNSTGTMKIHATGKTVPEANQELFIFKKIAGSWKIARYAFSTTLPQ